MAETSRQLEMLGELQRHLLPKVVPQLPGWSWRGHHVAGRWPGGDFYDFLTLPDGRVFLIVADCSDQGAPSVALAAMVRVVLHACPLSSGMDRVPFCPFKEPVMQPPHILLGHLNELLVENSLQEQFMTAFCGILDPAEGQFHYANAGHPAPHWWRARTRSLETLNDVNGLPLGLHKHLSYHHKRIMVEPGDVLVFFSDGLTAALNRRGELFGSERLKRIFLESAHQGAEAVKTSLLGQLEKFLDGEAPSDDITLVVLERRE